MRRITSGIGAAFDQKKAALERPMAHHFYGEFTQKRLLVRSLGEHVRMGEYVSWHQREKKIVSLDGLDPECLFGGILLNCHETVDGRIQGTVVTRAILQGVYPSLREHRTGQSVYAVWETEDRQSLSLDPPGVHIGAIWGREGDSILVAMVGMDAKPYRVNGVEIGRPGSTAVEQLNLRRAIVVPNG